MALTGKVSLEFHLTDTALEKEKVDISGFKKIVQTEETKQKEPEEVKGAPMKDYPLVEIEEMFKINSKELVAVFEDVKAPQTTYYSVDDCREVISKYITKNELEHANKKNNAFLDANLVKLIKNESDIQKDYKTGKPITNKGCLFKDIELFLRPFHVIRKIGIVAKDAEKIKPGYIPKVKIVIEKFMNKNITRVIGLETWEIDFKDACHVFQVKLAVGVSVCESEKSFSSEHIKIQGIHPDRVESILIDEFKIPRKHIDQINTLKGKKNKAKKK